MKVKQPVSGEQRNTFSLPTNSKKTFAFPLFLPPLPWYSTNSSCSLGRVGCGANLSLRSVSPFCCWVLYPSGTWRPREAINETVLAAQECVATDPPSPGECGHSWVIVLSLFVYPITCSQNRSSNWPCKNNSFSSEAVQLQNCIRPLAIQFCKWKLSKATCVTQKPVSAWISKFL